MIDRNEILSFSHYKKGKAYTGSKKGMRYRIQKRTKEEEDRLVVWIWPEPLCFEKTKPEKLQETEFAFTEEGYEQVLAFLNNAYETGTWTATNS